MSEIGNYIHYHTRNYELFGTTENGPSNYYESNGVLQKRMMEMRQLAWSLHKKYNSSKLQELERFMNSIFYPEGERSDVEEKQFIQMKQYVETEFQKKFSDFVIDWDHGLGTYAKGTHSIGQKSEIGTLKKVQSQLNQALERVKSANTKDKIENAKKEIEQALATLEQAGSFENPKVTIGKSVLLDTDNLIDSVNAALRASMYNNAATGYVFELALAAFSGQMLNQVSTISADLANKALQGIQKSKTSIKIDKISKDYFDAELFGNLINQTKNVNLGVWQRTPDGTAFEFSTPTQDKLDVALSFDGEMYNISAKNYSNIMQNDIHLVSGTPLLSMIMDDDVDYINHYLNITSTYPGMRGTTNLTLAHETMKLTILLKSLTGLGSSTQGNMSDILVVNNRKTRRIYVKSIGELVTKISFRLDKIDQYMKIRGLGPNNTLNIKNEFIGDKDILSDANAKIRITKLLAQLHNVKISVSLKGNAITGI